MSIYINNIPIKQFNFSGGECHIELPAILDSSYIHVYAPLNSSDDIMSLMLTIDAVRRQCPANVIDLTIPYFPYARQDRVCNPGEALSVKVMADLINSLSCSSVTIYDPHSDVAPALINNCVIKPVEQIIRDSSLASLISSKQMLLISPDAGSKKKVRAIAKTLNYSHTNIIYAGKTRDVTTGNITDTHLHGSVKNKNVIILDDICDGGRTFIELAKILKDQGANEIYLYVTHGIFSKGLDDLKLYFNHVYCFHAMHYSFSNEKDFFTLLCQE
jgi:ribose-phosphate pyrophosphokinase